MNEMNEMNEKQPNNRIDWNEQKVKYITGNCKSLREFAKEESLRYNGNFLRMTKSWVQQKAKNRMQMGCKIIEKISEEEINKAAALNSKIQTVSEMALNATEEFFKNKDYQRYAYEERNYKTDEDGDYITDSDGYKITFRDVEIAQAPFVQINKVKSAVDVIRKITSVIEKTSAYPIKQSDDLLNSKIKILQDELY